MLLVAAFPCSVKRNPRSGSSPPAPALVLALVAHPDLVAPGKDGGGQTHSSARLVLATHRQRTWSERGAPRRAQGGRHSRQHRVPWVPSSAAGVPRGPASKDESGQRGSRDPRSSFLRSSIKEKRRRRLGARLAPPSPPATVLPTATGCTAAGSAPPGFPFHRTQRGGGKRRKRTRC